MDQAEADNMIDGLSMIIRRLEEYHEQAWSACRFREAELWADEKLRLTKQARTIYEQAYGDEQA